jgi:single-stranded DNA-specific DHH superfamily exonuclease
MLTEKQVEEIREHLERAQNPVFFFDNDQDGLCSFLLLQRFIERGRGVPVRSFPSLDQSYFRKVDELNADYVFILDKPVVSAEFFEEAEKINMPVVWIDHHEIDVDSIPSFVNYYNPLYTENKTNEPVTVLCHQIANQKKDLWLAVVGAIADKFVPEYYKDFKKEYPELAIDSDEAFEILFRSEIGKVARMFGFGLKDKTTNVINMLKFLMKAKSPQEVLEESNATKHLHKRFGDLNKKYRKFLGKAVEEEEHSKNVLFFKYGGDLSISADLSNELSFMFPKKVVLVAYMKGDQVNISVRGKKVREKIVKIIEGLENATGGGHEDAVGVKIREKDLEKFKEEVEDVF